MYEEIYKIYLQAEDLSAKDLERLIGELEALLPVKQAMDETDNEETLGGMDRL